MALEFRAYIFPYEMGEGEKAMIFYEHSEVLDKFLADMKGRRYFIVQTTPPRKIFCKNIPGSKYQREEKFQEDISKKFDSEDFNKEFLMKLKGFCRKMNLRLRVKRA